jgi:hypothetical protein
MGPGLVEVVVAYLYDMSMVWLKEIMKCIVDILFLPPFYPLSTTTDIYAREISCQFLPLSVTIGNGYVLQLK